MKKKTLILTILGIAFLSLGISGVRANPSRIVNNASCTTSGTLATTSVSYIRPGLGTTTVTCDLVSVAAQAGGVDSMDSAILGIQFNASTTNPSPNLTWKLEYSQDGIDWYQEDVELVSNATTTTHVENFKVHTWRVATTTIGSATTGLGGGRKIVNIQAPVRYARAVFYLPAGSTNGSLWAQIVGKAENLR